MKHLLTLLSLIIAAAICSCSGNSVDRADEAIRNAEMALAQGDMDAAASVTAHLVGDKNLSGLTPRQLGRLSLIYMQLADSTDQGDNVSTATECYRKAYEIDPDSASVFYSGVAPEHTSHVMMLSSIVGSLDNPADSLALLGDTAINIPME